MLVFTLIVILMKILLHKSKDEKLPHCPFRIGWKLMMLLNSMIRRQLPKFKDYNKGRWMIFRISIDSIVFLLMLMAFKDGKLMWLICFKMGEHSFSPDWDDAYKLIGALHAIIWWRGRVSPCWDQTIRPYLNEFMHTQLHHRAS